MIDTLAEKTCTPCRGGVPPLTREEAQRLQIQVSNWELVDDAHRIERSFRFGNFENCWLLFRKLASSPRPKGITLISVSVGAMSPSP